MTVRKNLLANLKARDSTIRPLKTKTCMYFSLCIDVAKMHNVTYITD